MGRIVGAYVMPHPPIILEEIGNGDEREAEKTIQGCRTIAREIGSLRPSTIIIISPHGTLFSDAVAINVMDTMKGSFGSFRHPEIQFTFQNNKELVGQIGTMASEKGIICVGMDDDVARTFGVSADIDHGALVPLYFVNKEYSDYKLVHISLSGISLEEQYLFGRIMGDAVRKLDENVVIIASGDLSHRLNDRSGYGYNEKGSIFDNSIVKALGNADIDEVLSISNEVRECAGECGYRSVVMMFGALDGYDVSGEVLSYEGPYGVGYSNARFKIGGFDEGNSKVNSVFERGQKAIRSIRDGEDEYVKLARDTVETYVREGIIIEVPDTLSNEITKSKSGVFVSIKKNGDLRGCIGTIEPVYENMAKEIINNAISASARDPRFDPVEEHELNKLIYSVDILMEPEDISSREMLDPKRYGVIVYSGRKSGLLLPNLEGIETVEEQLEVVLRKAGIRENEDYGMRRFEVIRHH